MRTREEIEKVQRESGEMALKGKTSEIQALGIIVGNCPLILETLLDIRELLIKQKEDITCTSGTGSITVTPNSPVNYARVTTHCPDCTGYGGNVYYEGKCPKHKQL